MTLTSDVGAGSTLTTSVARAVAALEALPDEGHLPDEELARAVTEVALAMGCEAASLYVADRQPDQLVLAATFGLSRSSIGFITFRHGVGITGTAAARRGPVQRADVIGDPLFLSLPGFDQSRYRSILAVPVVAGDGGVIGVLNVQSVAVHSYDDAEVQALEELARSIARRLEVHWQGGDLALRLLGPGLLTGFTEWAAAASSLDSVCERFTEAVERAMPNTIVTVTVHDECDAAAATGDPSPDPDPGDDTLLIPIVADRLRARVRIDGFDARWRAGHAVRWLEPMTNALAGAVARLHVTPAPSAPRTTDREHARASLIELVLANSGIDAIVERGTELTATSLAVVDRHGGLLAGTPPAAVMARLELTSGPTELGTLLAGAPVSEQPLLSAVAEALALELAAWRARFEMEARLRGDLLTAIVDHRGDTDPAPALTMRATFAGLDLTRTYLPVKLATASSSDVSSSELFDQSSLVRAVHRHFGTAPSAVTFARHDGVLALIDDSSMSPSSIARRLDELIADYEAQSPGTRLASGISRPAGDLAALPDAVVDAEKAARLAHRLGRRGPVRPADLGADALLAELLGRDVLADFITTHIGALIAHDVRKRGDLLRTVEALFLAGDNLRAAADALSVHVNTLRYRMDRIRELTGLRFDQAEERQTLYLAVRAHRLLASAS